MGDGVLDVGCWVLDVGCWVLDVGFWMLGVGCWVLDVGCWMLDVGCWVYGTIPEGWPIIAQHFNVGYASLRGTSPEGTAETLCDPSAVPSGLVGLRWQVPNVETLSRRFQWQREGVGASDHWQSSGQRPASCQAWMSRFSAPDGF
jgi:hypothetical protein